jgi:hypothetical protein
MSSDTRLKMRAECSTDVGMLLVEAMEHGLTVHALEVGPWDPGVYSCDDVVATFVLRGPHISSQTGEIVNCELNRDETLSVIGKITDGHVMLETLQPVANYTGERQTPEKKPTSQRELPRRKRKRGHTNLLVFPATGTKA